MTPTYLYMNRFPVNFHSGSNLGTTTRTTGRDHPSVVRVKNKF